MEKLISAVRNQISTDVEYVDGVLKDVAEHGAAGGFSGFTYYKDTFDFASENMRLILYELVEESKEFGYDSAAHMVSEFSCLKGEGFTQDAINSVIWNDSENLESFDDSRSNQLFDEATLVCNSLAWYALEKVAREFVSQQEEIV